MKKRYACLASLFIGSISINLNAQQWMQEPYLQTSNRVDSMKSYNFYEIQKAFQLYEKENAEITTTNEESNREDVGHFQGYNQFKRWEWFNEQRVYPSGNFPSVDLVLNEYNKFLHNTSTSTGRRSNPNTTVSQTWVNLGSPLAPIGDYAGTGRVNCMAFMPGDNNTIFIGAACGGVWKSTDAGQTWVVLNTDQLPSLSITSIVIDPTNTNNIYIATGDNFTGFPISGVLKQGHFSAGIFKSSDGGNTWVLAGMPSTQAQQFIPQQLILDPITPNIMLLASNTGIWRTTDNGTNWSMVRANFFYSVEFNPLNHNVVYATDRQGLWRSNNNGVTWVYKGGGYPNTSNAGRVSLAVTPADTNYIYLWGPTAGFKRSTNGGTTITTMASPDAIAQPYGYVDRAIGVSKTNALDVMVGGLTTAKSLNGGTSWAAASDFQNHLLTNYFHADVKKIIYEPGSGTKLYALHDGGIAVSSDNSTTWTDISNGLQITEIYKVASSPFNPDTVYYGAQDNGTNRWDASVASVDMIYGGDGFQPLVDPDNPLIIFASAQLGSFRKSIDGGVNFVQASPGQALWDPPIKFNPLNSQTMYFGCTSGVKKNYTGSLPLGSWFNVSATTLDLIIALDVTKADTSYIYAASMDSMIRSVNGGTNWTYITSGLPVNSAAISYITASPADPNSVYVCFSGYSAGNKVFMSTNGGNSWINYSGTLPNIPVNCLVYVEGSNQGVYIGTDFGVFYRDSTSTDWISYNTGLPNVVVNHLDVQYATMKLRAGTYGRGLWESDLLMPVSSFTANPPSVCEGTPVNFSDMSAGNVTSWNWSFPGGNPSSSNLQNPTVTYSTSGVYNVTLVCANANGSSSSGSTITVNALPAVPTITANQNILTSSSVAGNQWYLNAVIIPGATQQNYTVTQNGIYTVVVTDPNGCSSTSAPYNFVNTGMADLNSENSIHIIPNPNNGIFRIEAGQLKIEKIIILNTLGEIVFESENLNPEINLSQNAKGIYLFRMISDNKIYSKKIVVK